VLWLLTYYGRTSLVVPIWVSLGTTVLPYLYLALLGAYVLSYGLLREQTEKNIVAGLAALLLLSMVVLWGGRIIPDREQASAATSIRLMVWNVQRMGELSKPRGQQAKCIADVIRETKPDILALLEITAHQLSDLQREVSISPANCKWSDYYGTGKKRFGGLAACILQSRLKLTILQRRQLGLPPGWKYLFVEVQPQSSVSTMPVNFIALHVAPPKITEKRIANIISDIIAGNAQGLSDLTDVLADYKKQVVLQGSQVSTALKQIKTFRDPTIVAGDFNSTRDSAIHAELRKNLTDTWSEAGWGFGASRYWGGFLPLRIDYIYVSHEFSVQTSQTIASDCSDHRPIVSEVFLKQADLPSSN